MISERVKDRKHSENGKILQCNDLCNKIEKLQLSDLDAIEIKDTSSNLKHESVMEKASVEEFNKIDEQLSKISIVGEEKPDINITQLREEEQVCKNIVCDKNDTLYKNSEVLERNIIDGEELHNEEKVVPKSKLNHENNTNNGVISDCAPLRENVKKEADCEDKLQKDQSNESKKVDDLCSRGPISQKTSHGYQPYGHRNMQTCTQTSGGTVFVAEPLGPPPNMYMLQNNIPAFNITPNISEPVPFQVQSAVSCGFNEKKAPDTLDEEDQEIVKNLLNIFPAINNALDIYCCGQSTQNEQNIEVPSTYQLVSTSSESGDDEGNSSTHESDASPLGSPEVSGPCQRPPQSASVNSFDSGIPECSPLPVAEYTNENSQMISNFSNEMYFQTMANDRRTLTKDWINTVSVPEVTKYRPILPKPDSVPKLTAKEKLDAKLDKVLKRRAWAKICSLRDENFVYGDEKDGDTQLMITVSNNVRGQLELIYAMVERMRTIPGSLAKVNNRGHSALYIACKTLSHQPLVPAYIAEALLEQNVDVAGLTFNGLTLPQILQKEPNTHDEVLRELLSVKDSSGKYVFEAYRSSDVNGNL